MKKSILPLIMLISFTLVGQSISDSIATLDELFKLKWKVKGQKYSSNPLVHDGLVFETFGLQYALDAVSGEKLYFNNPSHRSKIKTYTKDSLIYFTSRNGGALVNIFSGKTIYRSANRLNKPWVKRPRIIRGQYLYFAENDSVFSCINVIDGKTKWKNNGNNIYDFPLITENIVLYSDSKFLYGVDKNNGSEVSKIELGAFISNPQLVSGIVYGWIKDKGPLALDLSRKKTVWEIPDKKKQSEFEMIIAGEVLYINSSNLKAYKLTDGKILWSNSQVQSFETFVLGETNNYVLAYKIIDDYSVLIAADKKTGNVKYEGFTKITDQIKDPKVIRPLADLESSSFRFGNKMHKNFMYAVDLRGDLYCFEVLE